MESTFLKRFRLNSHKNDAKEILTPSVPINKQMKPSQVYSDFDHLFQSIKHLPKRSFRQVQSPEPSSITEILPAKTSELRPSIFKSSTPGRKRDSDISATSQEILRNSNTKIDSTFSKKSARHFRINQSVDFSNRTPLIYSQENLGSIRMERSESPVLSSSSIPEKLSKHSAHFSNLSNSEISDRNLKYKPYSFNDYLAIKHDKYFMLGGLGSINVGTDSWKSACDKKERMADYYKNIRQSYRKLAA